MDIRNVAIIAHVDHGKTTLVDQLLRDAGVLRRSEVGVDRIMDSSDLERERGITILSKNTAVTYGDTRINIVDTPGHADFASETERALWAIDGAVLVISGTDGVQAHTENLWRILRERHIPTIAFVNKLDRETASYETCISDIRSALTFNAFNLNNEEDLALQAGRGDESILDGYLEQGTLDREKAIGALSRIMKEDCLPVLGGSAYTGKGVPELMNAVTALLPAPGGDENAPVSGIVFALENDAALGRAAWVRLFDGKSKTATA